MSPLDMITSFSKMQDWQIITRSGKTILSNRTPIVEAFKPEILEELMKNEVCDISSIGSMMTITIRPDLKRIQHLSDMENFIDMIDNTVAIGVPKDLFDKLREETTNEN